MNIFNITPHSPLYPAGLRQYLKDDAPPEIAFMGLPQILQNKKTAIFCSNKCPASLILQAHDLAKQWVKQNITVVSGFHSPVEQECLKILERGTQPVIICPARSIDNIRIRPYLSRLVEARLLMLSPFALKAKRMTSKMAWERNRFVAALADTIFVVYAEPKSKTELLCQEIVGWGKPIYTFAGEHNQKLVALGIRTSDQKA
jgi:predicted Rossmann fold nucleotide-binding protein DprA/Smf involved in DNA uptake